MPKKKNKSKNSHSFFRGNVSPRQLGLKAFDSSNFEAAISQWTQALEKETNAQEVARLQVALAEAHFRLALTRSTTPANQVILLQKALAWQPDDTRYVYHLGLALHHSGDLAGAIEQYRQVGLQPRAANSWPGLALVLALATLEQQAQVDINQAPGYNAAVRETLTPVLALLQHEPPPPNETALGHLWQGLSLLDSGYPSTNVTKAKAPKSKSSGLLVERQATNIAKIEQARPLLDDSRPLPSLAATNIRRYYKGLTAVQLHDTETALCLWQKIYNEEGSQARPWLRSNLIALFLQQNTEESSTTAISNNNVSQDTSASVEMDVPASSTLELAATNSALGEVLLAKLDRAAYIAATNANWSQAASLWEAGRQLVAAGSAAAFGSPRPWLHNLALAYERQEEWVKAAEQWRGLLRTRPRLSTRKNVKEPALPSEDSVISSDEPSQQLTDSQLTWIRKRVVVCYKRAGQPGEAVAMFKLAIKSEPTDLAMRLEYVAALRANEQEQAALNELHRIIEIDPSHIAAQLQLADFELERGLWQSAKTRLVQLAERYPANQEVKHHLAEMLLSQAKEYHEGSLYQHAKQLLKEGQAVAPDDYRFPLELARIAIDEGQKKQVPALLAETLRLGVTAADQSLVYGLVMDCWAVLDDMVQVRAVLAEAEQKFKPEPTFYIEVGANLLRHKAPAEQPDNPFAFLASLPGPKPKKQPAKQLPPAANPWSDLAIELFGKAEALKPGDATVALLIGGMVMLIRPDLALPYAREAVRLAPQDPRTLFGLGLTLGLDSQGSEAKQFLQKAAKLARQQNNPSLAQTAEEMSRAVESPMFKMMLTMGNLLGGLDADDDFDDFGPGFDFF